MLEVGDIPQYCDIDALRCSPVGGLNISAGGESETETGTGVVNNAARSWLDAFNKEHVHHTFFLYVRRSIASQVSLCIQMMFSPFFKPPSY